MEKENDKLQDVTDGQLLREELLDLEDVDALLEPCFRFAYSIPFPGSFVKCMRLFGFVLSNFIRICMDSIFITSYNKNKEVYRILYDGGSHEKTDNPLSAHCIAYIHVFLH